MSDLTFGIVLKARKDGSLEGTVAGTKKEFDQLRSAAAAAGTASAQAGSQTKASFNSAEQAVNRTGAALDSAKRLVIGYVAAQVSIGAAREWLSQADQITLVNARLKQTTISQKELRETQDQLYASAQRLGVSYVDMAASTARLEPAVRTLGGGAREAAKLAEIVVATARIQGSSTAEATSSAIQFAQAIGSGVLAGDELKSILENNQMLARVLAEGLGVSSTQLKKMGEEGRLSSDVVATAVLKGYEKVQAAAAKLPVTFEAGMQRLANAAQQSIGFMNEHYGITSALGGAASALARAWDEQTAAQKAATNGAESNKEAIAVLAITAAAAVDTFGYLRDVSMVLVPAFIALGAAALSVGSALQGNAGDAYEFGKRAVTAFKDIGVAAGETLAKWNTQTTFVERTTEALLKAGESSKKAAGSQVVLGQTLDQSNQRWLDATKGLATISNAEIEHKRALDAVNLSYVGRIDTINRTYSNESERLAKINKQMALRAEAEAAIDRARDDAKDALRKKNQVSLEAALRADQLAADEKVKVAKFVLEQEKLGIADALDYNEFAYKQRLISEREYIAKKGALQVEGISREMAELQKQVDAERELQQKRAAVLGKAVGKSDQEKARNELTAATNRLTEAENRLTLKTQERGNAQNAVDRAGTLAADAELRKLAEIGTASEEALRGMAKESEDLEFQIALYGKTEAEIRRMTVARQKDLQIQQLSKKVMEDIAGATSVEQQQRIAEEYARQVAFLNEQKLTIPELQGNVAALASQTNALGEAWRQVDQTGFDAFKSIMEGSGSALDSLKKLGNFLKNELLKWLYQMTAQKWAIQLFGAFTGGPGAAVAQNAATSAAGNIFSSFAGNAATSALGASVFGSAGAYAAAVPGLTSAAAGSQAAMLAAQTAEFGAAGLTSTAAAGGSTLAGSLASLGPYAAAAIAIYAIYKTLKKGGGAKEGGGFIGEYSANGALLSQGDARSLYTPASQDAQFQKAGEGIAAQFFDSLKKLGGSVGTVKFSFGGDTDPKGTADNRIKNFVDVNGQRVYTVMDKGVGRNAEELQAQLDLEAKRAIVAALKASSLPAEVAKIFDEVDVATASADALNGLIDLGTVLNGLKESGLSITVDRLRELQQNGETLAETLARVTQEHGSLVQALANVGQAIQAIKSDAYDFNRSIGQKIIGVGGKFDLAGLASGRMSDLKGTIGAETDPARRMSAIQSYVGAIDDYLASRKADIEASSQAAADAANAQAEAQRAINEARVSAIQQELDVAKQWVSVLDRAKGALQQMQLSTLNPAAATVRYQIAKDMVQAAKAAYTANASTTNATKYLEALQAQSGLFSTVFQRPSEAAQQEYNDVATQISALAGAAEGQAAKAERLQQQLVDAQAATAASSAVTAAGVGDVSAQMAALNQETAGLYTWAQEQYNLAAGEQLDAAYTQQELLNQQLDEMFTQTDLLTEIRNGITGGPTTTTTTNPGTGSGGGNRIVITTPVNLTNDLSQARSFVLETVVDAGALIKQTVDRY